MQEPTGETGSRSETEPSRKAARTMIEFAYQQLRHDIVRNHLPPGSRLRVEALKEVYGVGSGTLREALSLLIADTLVTTEGQRGFRVAPISIEDLRDITNMRKLLEIEALRLSIETGDDNWEAGVVAAYHRLAKTEERLYDDPQSMGDEWEDRNRAFHEALIAACDSKWLRHFRAILYQQSERYRRLALASRSIPRNVHVEHKAIMEAALARDAAAASRLTAEHIDRTLEVLSTVFSHTGADRGNGHAAAGPALDAAALPVAVRRPKQKSA